MANSKEEEAHTTSPCSTRRHSAAAQLLHDGHLFANEKNVRNSSHPRFAPLPSLPSFCSSVNSGDGIASPSDYFASAAFLDASTPARTATSSDSGARLAVGPSHAGSIGSRGGGGVGSGVGGGGSSGIASAELFENLTYQSRVLRLRDAFEGRSGLITLAVRLVGVCVHVYEACVRGRR